MSVTFPTLSKGPVIINKSIAQDPSIRSKAEDGLVISRRRFTGNKSQFEVKYDDLPLADKTLLEAMQDSAGVGADTILWTNEDPNDSTVYTVRLSPEGIKFNIIPSDYDLHTAEFTFVEA